MPLEVPTAVVDATGEAALVSTVRPEGRAITKPLLRDNAEDGRRDSAAAQSRGGAERSRRAVVRSSGGTSDNFSRWKGY